MVLSDCCRFVISFLFLIYRIRYIVFAAVLTITCFVLLLILHVLNAGMDVAIMPSTFYVLNYLYLKIFILNKFVP